jgi:predicted metal-dependent hydrolase
VRGSSLGLWPGTIPLVDRQVVAIRTPNQKLMSSRDPVRIPDRPPNPRRDRKRTAPIPPPFDEVMERFNAGQYRACVELLEELFFADRNTFFQGLLHLVVALLQIRLGMVRGPRIRLASAAELLSPYAPWHRGVDVESLLRAIEACRRRLPEAIVQIPIEEMESLMLPMPQLTLVPRFQRANRGRERPDACR